MYAAKLAKLTCAAWIRGTDGIDDEINEALREWVVAIYDKCSSFTSIEGHVYIELLNQFDQSEELSSPLNKFNPKLKLDDLLEGLSSILGRDGYTINKHCEAALHNKLKQYLTHDDPDIIEKAIELIRKI